MGQAATYQGDGGLPVGRYNEEDSHAKPVLSPNTLKAEN